MYVAAKWSMTYSESESCKDGRGQRVVTEARCLSTDLVSHPAITVTSHVINQLGDIGWQPVTSTCLQQQPDHGQLQQQQPTIRLLQQQPTVNDTTTTTTEKTKHYSD